MDAQTTDSIAFPKLRLSGQIAKEELAQAVGFSPIKASGPYVSRGPIQGKVGKQCFRLISYFLHVRAITFIQV